MEACTGLFAGTPNSNELVVIQGHDEVEHRETWKLSGSCFNYNNLVTFSLICCSLSL